MRLSIRPMHDSEAPLVRSTWTRSIDSSEHRDGRGRTTQINGRMRTVGANLCPWMRIGADSSMVTWAYVAMHRSWVKDQWDGLRILVATLAGHDEAIGWVATTPPGEHPLVVHYVFTIDSELARRKGVATALLRAALETADHRPARFSHMTPVAKGILDTIATDARPTIRAEAAMH